MSLYRGSARRLRSQIEDGSLVPTLIEQFRHQIGSGVSPSEIRSWDRSLQVLSADLVEAGLGDVEVLVEHQLPLTSKRADVVLCGRRPHSDAPSYVVVELKQWTHAAALEGTDDVVVLEGLGERAHPGSQVEGYCDYIRDFVAGMDEHAQLIAGAAYLHNAADGDVASLFVRQEGDSSRLFTGSRRGEWLDYLRGRLSKVSGAGAADDLLNASIRPSKQLLALAADEVKHREQFVLLDEQRTAYALVMRAVEQAKRANAKEVIVVSGGPGSGKSVIALSLLGELSRRGVAVLHATGSSAFTTTLRKVAGFRSPRVQRMFKYFNQFVSAEQNGLDVLILDEAHRIRETSANRYTPAAERTGRPQVEELIDAARVPVFLLDQHQVVRPGEIGSVHDITEAATRMGLPIRLIELDAQFRCGGSRAYEEWVLRLLGLMPGGPVRWEGDDSFAVEVVESPSLMEAHLRGFLAHNYAARISAGYCWRWSKPPDRGALKADVQIGDWKHPWNNPKDSRHGDAPPRALWSSDPAGFDQVGCVYTAQGFEYDYSGVIIGPDLVWRTDHWEARPEYSHDNQVKRASVEEFDRAVRNTYKVLLTRGMRGTTIYSTDEETQALLRDLVG